MTEKATHLPSQKVTEIRLFAYDHCFVSFAEQI